MKHIALKIHLSDFTAFKSPSHNFICSVSYLNFSFVDFSSIPSNSWFVCECVSSSPTCNQSHLTEWNFCRGTHWGLGFDHVIRTLAATAVLHGIPRFLIEDNAEEENKGTLDDRGREEGEKNHRNQPVNEILQGNEVLESSPGRSWSQQTGSGRWSCRCWRRAAPENMWLKPAGERHMLFSGPNCRVWITWGRTERSYWGAVRMISVHSLNWRWSSMIKVHRSGNIRRNRAAYCLMSSCFHQSIIQRISHLPIIYILKCHNRECTTRLHLLFCY